MLLITKRRGEIKRLGIHQFRNREDDTEINKNASTAPLESSTEVKLCAFMILRVPCDLVRFSGGGCGFFGFVLALGLIHTPLI